MLSTKADVRPLALEVDKPLTAEPKILVLLSGVQTWTLTVVVSVVVSVVVVAFVVVSVVNEYALSDVNAVPLIKSPLLLKVAVNVQSCATLNLIVFSLLNCTYELSTFLRL